MRLLVLGFGLGSALIGPVIAAVVVVVVSQLDTKLGHSRVVLTTGILVCLIVVGVWIVGDRAGEHELVSPRRVWMVHSAGLAVVIALGAAAATWLAGRLGTPAEIACLVFAGVLLVSLAAAAFLGPDLAWVGALPCTFTWVMSEQAQQFAVKLSDKGQVGWCALIASCVGYVGFNVARRALVENPWVLVQRARHSEAAHPRT